MARIELYRGLEKRCALTDTVQAALDRVSYEIATLATADLEDKFTHHYSENKSFITIGRGKVDRGIILNDPDSPDAPWAIEMGTRRSKGIHVLTKAAVKVFYES